MSAGSTLASDGFGPAMTEQAFENPTSPVGVMIAACSMMGAAMGTGGYITFTSNLRWMPRISSGNRRRRDGDADAVHDRSTNRRHADRERHARLARQQRNRAPAAR